MRSLYTYLCYCCVNDVVVRALVIMGVARIFFRGVKVKVKVHVNLYSA